MTCPLGHHEGEYRRATNSRGNRGAAITTRYLEDFAVGHTFGSGRVRVDKERIKTFAAEFDPQPFHLDEEAARNTIFKGLAASGVHTAVLTTRLLVESELNPAGGIIGARFDELRLAAARAARRRATRRERSPRGKAVKVASQAGAGQVAGDDAEPERPCRAGCRCQSDRATPRQVAISVNLGRCGPATPSRASSTLGQSSPPSARGIVSARVNCWPCGNPRPDRLRVPLQQAAD
jgi:MaoC like domain